MLPATLSCRTPAQRCHHALLRAARKPVASARRARAMRRSICKRKPRQTAREPDPAFRIAALNRQFCTPPPSTVWITLVCLPHQSEPSPITAPANLRRPRPTLRATPPSRRVRSSRRPVRCQRPRLGRVSFQMLHGRPCGDSPT